MSKVEKLKKQAADFEAKRQIDKAVATYLELFKVWEADDSEVDVALYNRAGDLLIREGNVGDAMSVWEKAVDHYSEGGFHNNAIALCNKILRHSPGRNSIYYKLGKISAKKGFRGDAKKNFLEYADRMQKADKIDEAFRALKEFADLCPDEDDIRQMLADQLAKLGRNAEAIEQLQVLYERYESTGDSEAAAKTVERMRAIDPTVEPKRSGPSQSRQTTGLVFIDLDSPPSRPSRKSSSATPIAPRPTTAEKQRKSATAGLPLIDIDDTPTPEPVAAEAVAPPAPAPPVPEPAPIVTDVTFGASFGTDDPGVVDVTPLELEPTSMEPPPSEDRRVSASLSSPEDATFGTFGLEELPMAPPVEPQSIEPIAGLEFTSTSVVEEITAAPEEPRRVSTPGLAEIPLDEAPVARTSSASEMVDDS